VAADEELDGAAAPGEASRSSPQPASAAATAQVTPTLVKNRNPCFIF
jgi:hypothetical protein